MGNDFLSCSPFKRHFPNALSRQCITSINSRYFPITATLAVYCNLRHPCSFTTHLCFRRPPADNSSQQMYLVDLLLMYLRGRCGPTTTEKPSSKMFFVCHLVLDKNKTNLKKMTRSAISQYCNKINQSIGY